MGASTSKPRREENPEQRRQREIQRYGVLIPPVFAVATGSNSNKNNGDPSKNSDQTIAQIQQQPNICRSNTPLSAHDRLPLSLSLVDYLSVTHFGHGLLHDFMTPGMWILAGGVDANRTAITTVRASLPLTPGGGGQMSFASSPTSANSRIELCAGTEGPMHLFATHQLFPKGFIFANTNSSGTGYIGGQIGISMDRTKPIVEPDENYLGPCLTEEQDQGPSNNAIYVQLGSWIPLQWNSGSKATRSTQMQQQPPKQQQDSFAKSTLPDWMKQSPQHVHGYISVDMLGSTTALETRLNTDSLETEVSKYFSIRLDGPSAGGGGDDRGGFDHNNMSNSSSSSPPLWLTMTSNSDSSVINISQLLSFDRINLNPLDMRAPKVRNAFGWAVQVEKPSPNSRSEYDSTPSQVSVAAAWQYNRNLAFKLIGTTSETTSPGSSAGDTSINRNYTCTLGVLLKRWKQPRITCSLLGRYDFKTQKSSFVGIGLELETDASTLMGQMGTAAGGVENYYTTPGAQVSDHGTPATKATMG